MMKFLQSTDLTVSPRPVDDNRARITFAEYWQDPAKVFTLAAGLMPDGLGSSQMEGDHAGREQAALFALLRDHASPPWEYLLCSHLNVVDALFVHKCAQHYLFSPDESYWDLDGAPQWVIDDIRLRYKSKWHPVPVYPSKGSVEYTLFSGGRICFRSRDQRWTEMSVVPPLPSKDQTSTGITVMLSGLLDPMNLLFDNSPEKEVAKQIAFVLAQFCKQKINVSRANRAMAANGSLTSLISPTLRPQDDVPRPRGGRPRYPENEYARYQVLELGRSPREVFPEWAERKGKDAVEALADPLDSFRKALRKDKGRKD